MKTNSKHIIQISFKSIELLSVFLKTWYRKLKLLIWADERSLNKNGLIFRILKTNI